jgi:TrmH family RNA methyltransferase
MRRIASRQNPAVARYRAAARGELDEVVLLDGAHLILEALEAGVPVREAAVAAGAMDRPESQAVLDRLRDAGVECLSVTAPVMAAMSPVRSPAPFVALAARPAHPNGAMFENEAPLVVIAVDVQDPGNLGAIVRVAEAGGASGVIAAGCSADPFGWKALRGSMGSTLRLPVARMPASEAALAEVRGRGCRVVATTPRATLSAFDVDLRGPVAVLIGGEGGGLAPAVLAAADDQVSVPMQAPVESLNAAVTAALLVYEARRQRQT